MLFDTLYYIGKRLNEDDVLWGVGASVLLNEYNLVDNPKDIDLLVGLHSIEKVDKILRELGEKKAREQSDAFATEHFYEYNINGVEVDVMAGLKLRFGYGLYEFTFDEKSITKIKEQNGVKIPFTALEDWYVIYQMIPGRLRKVQLIEDYLLESEVFNAELLNRSLHKQLPDSVRNRIKNILGYKGLRAE